MGSTYFYEETLPDFQGSQQKFTLSVSENDGLVIVGLAADAEPRACMLEPDEARKVIAALEDAVSRIGYKA